MKIRKIKLKNFRNYSDLEITLNDKLNIFIGDNAVGKTNILESIYVLALTKSFFSISDKNLIKFSSDFTKIDAILENNKKIMLLINDKNKILKINNKEINRYSDYISTVKVIIFNPDNINLIKNAPSSRRKFLNIEISQLSKDYLVLLNKYNNLLKQKNEYLKIIKKTKKINYHYINSVNELLSDLSIKIYIKRDKFINDINQNIGDIFNNITFQKQLKIKYISNVEDDSSLDLMKKQLYQKLTDNLEKEIKYGISLYGIHRDDFAFYLNDKNLSLYGSQGQMRTAVLSLKLSEIEVFSKETSDKPIVLLDDIFSELDVNKRNNLIKYLNKDIQTIITTTDINLINSNYLKDAYILRVENNQIQEEEK